MQWEADRGRTVAYFVFGTISRVLPIFAALSAKAAITAVLDDDTTGAVVAAVALGVTIGVSFVLVRVNGHVAAVLIEKTSECYDREILRLSTEITGIEHMENPAYLDQLEQLRLRPQALAQDGTFTSMVVWAPLQIGLVVLLLVGVSPVLLLLPVAAAVSIWLVRRSEHIRYAAFDASAEWRRLATDFFVAATSTERADEVARSDSNARSSTDTQTRGNEQSPAGASPSERRSRWTSRARRRSPACTSQRSSTSSRTASVGQRVPATSCSP